MEGVETDYTSIMQMW